MIVNKQLQILSRDGLRCWYHCSSTCISLFLTACSIPRSYSLFITLKIIVISINSIYRVPGIILCTLHTLCILILESSLWGWFNYAHLKIFYSFSFWLCWIFVAIWACLRCGKRGSTLELQGMCFSLHWRLLLQRMGSREGHAGFSSCSTWDQ